tara:strand:+ start:192 stop:443 length:252 start_codon:yes stop_codon:yes gene_type:complete
MALQKKRAPRSNPDIERTIQQVYDDINQVINAVNQVADEGRSLAKGKEGDIRVVKDSATNTYKIEAKTIDGWASVNLEISKGV